MTSQARLRMENLGKEFQAKRGGVAIEAGPPALQKTAEDELRAIAVRLLEEAGNINDVAASKLEAAVWKDRNLRDTLMAPMVRGACRAMIYSLVQKQRSSAWSGIRGGGRGGADSTARVIALGRGTASALFDFPLPGGKMLREATGAEISTAADYYDERATDSRAKANWLRLIAQSLGPDAKASDVLTEERLAELQTEALRG